MQWRSILVSGCALFMSALLVLPTAAQTPSANTNGNVGFTRFAHTAVDVGPIDIYLGSNPQPIVSKLKFGDVTDFLPLSTDLSGYKVHAADSPADSQPLFSLEWGVKGNKSELIVAADLDCHKAFIFTSADRLYSLFRQSAARCLAEYGLVSLYSGAVQMYFLAETGIRMDQRNFWWSAEIGLFILFAITLVFLIRHVRLHLTRSSIIVGSIFLVHVFCGIVFLAANGQRW